MSTWQLIGTIQPRNEWKLYGQAVTGIETFRIKQSLSSKKPHRLSGYLAQFFFGDNTPVAVRRLYPVFDDTPVINLKIPDHLRQAGYTSRFIGVKLNPKIKDPSGFVKWYVSLEALTDAPIDRTDAILQKLDAIV